MFYRKWNSDKELWKSFWKKEVIFFGRVEGIVFGLGKIKFGFFFYLSGLFFFYGV